MNDVSEFFRLFDLPACPLSEESTDALAEAMQNTSVAGHTSLGSGYVYLGQFIDHDMTEMETTSNEPSRHNIPLAGIKQLRNPALDLDSVYGNGYSDERIKVGPTGEMLLGTTVATDTLNSTSLSDLPRKAPEGRTVLAAIPDLRNDENLVIAQLHVLFLKLHNAVLGLLNDRDPERRFESARREVTNIYQSVVLYDFLPAICEREVVEKVLKPNYQSIYPAQGPDNVDMPVEFSVAAFRFGHSMIRQSYSVNEHTLPPRNLPIMTMIQMTGHYAFQNEQGVRHSGLPEHVAIKDWNKFFFTNSGAVNTARPISPAVSFKLADGQRPSEQSQLLAQRNLWRGVEAGLASAIAVIEHLNRTRCEDIVPLTYEEYASNYIFNGLSEKQIQEVIDHPPLWFYILTEAYTRGSKGRRLGPLGSLLVADTIVGILKAMDSPALNGRWTSAVLEKQPQDIRITDIIELVTNDEGEQT